MQELFNGEGHKEREVTDGRQPSKTSCVYSCVGEVSSRVGEPLEAGDGAAVIKSQQHHKVL